MVTIFKSCLPVSNTIFLNKSRKVRCKHKREKCRPQKLAPGTSKAGTQHKMLAGGTHRRLVKNGNILFHEAMPIKMIFLLA